MTSRKKGRQDEKRGEENEGESLAARVCIPCFCATAKIRQTERERETERGEE